MAVLKSKERNALPASAFGLPGARKYPMPDKSHAENAKARATQMAEKGKLSKADEKKIDRKADEVIKKDGGEKTKTVK